MQNEGAYNKLLTPLATSRSGLMMLLSGDLGVLNDQQREYLQHILELDEYMISMIKSWLDMDRLSRGQLVLDVEPCNIGSIIRAVVGGQVRLQRQAQWPMVLADPPRLKQIITYILESTRQADVRARTHEEFCTVTFQQRSGIRGQQRADIVQALHSSVPTTSLGIRIAQLLAEAHGGSLELNPHAAEGIRLHLKLPLAKQLNLL